MRPAMATVAKKSPHISINSGHQEPDTAQLLFPRTSTRATNSTKNRDRTILAPTGIFCLGTLALGPAGVSEKDVGVMQWLRILLKCPLGIGVEREPRKQNRWFQSILRISPSLFLIKPGNYGQTSSRI